MHKCLYDLISIVATGPISVYDDIHVSRTPRPSQLWCTKEHIMFLGATIFKSLFLPPHTSPSIIEEETWLIRKRYSSMFTKSVGELFQNTATQQWSLSSFEEYILSQGVPYRLISSPLPLPSPPSLLSSSS